MQIQSILLCSLLLALSVVKSSGTQSSIFCLTCSDSEKSQLKIKATNVKNDLLSFLENTITTLQNAFSQFITLFKSPLSESSKEEDKEEKIINYYSKNWSLIIAYGLLDLIIVFFCCGLIQICLDFSKKCQSNLSNYNKKLSFRKRYISNKNTKCKDPNIEQLQKQDKTEYGQQQQIQNDIEINLRDQENEELDIQRKYSSETVEC